jgi:hypothetical protein
VGEAVGYGRHVFKGQKSIFWPEVESLVVPKKRKRKE